MTTKKPFTLNKKIHIGFFPKELETVPFNFSITGREGIFTVTKELKDKYPYKETGIGQRHEIPIDEFEFSYTFEPWSPGIPKMEAPVEHEDAFMERWSLRDLFSIYNNVPESNKIWLNNLINKYNKK